MTTLSSTMDSLLRAYSEVRCSRCKRLLLKWEFSGVTRFEIKCPRCGSVDVIRLSTN